jgi:hypothetical protein
LDVTDLGDAWKTFRPIAAQQLDKDYRALLLTLDEINQLMKNNPSGAPKPKFDWPILAREGSTSGASGPISFKLTGSASARIEMEALRTTEQRPTVQTRLGFFGNLEMGAKFPFKQGLFEASVSRDTQTRLLFLLQGSDCIGFRTGFIACQPRVTL